MSDVTYKLVLKGYGSNEKGKYYIEQDLAEVLGIERQEAKKLLENNSETIKEGLTKDEGETLEKEIKATGAKCDLEDTRFDLSKFSLM